MTGSDSGRTDKAQPAASSADRVQRGILAALWLILVALTAISATSLVLWQRDGSEIRQILAERVSHDASQYEVVLAARQFLEQEVGYERPDQYFLAPIFSFMRPTALQVIEYGGDCAYRTRALIVMLRQFGIEASKIALYNSEGIAVHAVAEIQLPDGPRYVDALFNFVHEDASGDPLTLVELANPETLQESIDRAIEDGNEDARWYPLEEYRFDDARTINWNKHPLLERAYSVLAGLVGQDRARMFPRPYLSEEPALMVVVLNTGASVLLLIMIWGIGRFGRRPRSRGGRPVAT